ncbi:MAG: Ig-like domain-containing protein [Planctomycetota bacterium]
MSTPNPILFLWPLVLVLGGCDWSSDSDDGGAAGAPEVISVSPFDGALAQTPDVQPSVTFSEAMDPASIDATSIQLSDTVTGITVDTSVDYDSSSYIATIVPALPLAASRTYRGVVTTSVRDTAGVHLADRFTWSFTVAAESDPPAISGLDPNAGQSGVPVDATVRAVFDEPIDERTLTTTSFTLNEAATGDAVSGTVSVFPVTNTAVFIPDSLLDPATTYEARIAQSVSDTSGNTLPGPVSWSFTTGESTVQWQQVGGQISPLGTAAADPTAMVLGDTVHVGYRLDGDQVALQRWVGGVWSSPLDGDPAAGSLLVTGHGPTFTADASGVYLAFTHPGSGGPTGVATSFDHILAYRWDATNGWVALDGGTPVSDHGLAAVDTIDDANAPVIVLDEFDDPLIAYIIGDSTASPDVEPSLHVANIETTGVITYGPRNRRSDPQTPSVVVAIGTSPDRQHIFTAQWERASDDPERSDLYVSAFNGSGFAAAGESIAQDHRIGTDPSRPSIVANGLGEAYIAYTAKAANGTSELYVQHWDGANWQTMGPGPIRALGSLDHAGSADPELILVNSTLFLAWTETDTGGGSGIHVASWDTSLATVETWTLEGELLNIDRSRTASDPSLVWNDSEDTLYLAFIETVGGSDHLFARKRLFPATPPVPKAVALLTH